MFVFSIQIESSRSISSCEEPDSAIPTSNKFELARKGHKRAVSDTAVLLQKDLYQVVEPHELTQITEEDPKIPYQYPAPGLFFTRLNIFHIIILLNVIFDIFSSLFFNRFR